MKYTIKTRLEKIEVYFAEYEVEAESLHEAENEVLSGMYMPDKEIYMGSHEKEEIRK